MGKHTFVGTALLAVLVTTASLADAQGRHRGNNGDGGGRQRIPSRADSGGNGGSGGGGNRQGAERQAQPREGGRVQQPRADNNRDNNRDNGQNGQQADNGRRQVAPQDRPTTQGSPERNDGNRRAEARNNDGRDGHNDGRYGNRYATPRTGPLPVYRHGDHRVYAQPRHNYYVYPYPAYRYYGSTRYYGYRYYDPYFTGSFYWTNNAWQSQASYYGSSWDNGLGKLRLDIDQRDAEVYINGYYAGVIDDFDGTLQGLRLEPGNYQVEVRLPGFDPLQFDVRVAPGRTTTYRGSLLPE